jgi:hypothetical protein
LPSDDAYNFPVTLDLNGDITIRAKAVDQAKPTEIVLANSSWSGKPVRLNLNRKFLARALKLGFRDLLVYGDKVPVVCHDEHRHFVWATLEPESAIPPVEDAIRIESPSAEPQTAATQPQTRRKISPVSEPVSNPSQDAASSATGSSNGHARTNGRAKHNGEARRTKASQQDIASLIQQAERLRTSLRDTLVKVNELLRGLKRYRRQSRAVQQTLDHLRTLKTLGV